jgi:glycosyltransferase involved in cell wall biosynthesis
MMKIGIDASNIGGGGGITHLVEFLREFDPSEFKEISGIVVFSSNKVLSQLDEAEYLEKVSFPQFNGSLLKRVLFQLNGYDAQIKCRCDILLSLSGDYIGGFRPLVGMSRNMLLYERPIWKEIRQPKEIMRFWLNYQKQRVSFGNSDGIIFISNYAKSYVSKYINLADKEVEVIHHGISSRFKNQVKLQGDLTSYSLSKPFKFLYVSNVHIYKHQWNVIRAVGVLRKEGYPVELDLIGSNGFDPAFAKLQEAINKVDSKNTFIHYHGHVDHNEIDKFYRTADGIIYASTCENMPNILIESMASGLPIACSDKQPMPEFLKENGYYFNSYDVASIVKALRLLLENPEQSNIFSTKNIEEVRNYSWKQTSKRTFTFLLETFHNYKK